MTTQNTYLASLVHPVSGREYDVREVSSSYVATRNGVTGPVTDTYYELFFNGKLVALCNRFSDESFLSALAEVEGLAAPWATSARD